MILITTFTSLFEQVLEFFLQELTNCLMIKIKQTVAHYEQLADSNAVKLSFLNGNFFTGK